MTSVDSSQQNYFLTPLFPSTAHGATYQVSWDTQHTVITPRNITEAEAVLISVKSDHHHDLVGFDLEWKIREQCAEKTWPATVQISFSSITVVFQPLQMKGIPEALKVLLEDEHTPKVGVGIENDARKMYHIFDVKGRNFVDLSLMAWTLARDRLPDGRPFANLVSLQLLASEFADLHLKKFDNVPDWDKPELSLDLLTYAALDAYSSRTVCCKLLDIKASYDGQIPSEPFEFYWTFDITSHEATKKPQLLSLKGAKFTRTAPFPTQDQLPDLPNSDVGKNEENQVHESRFLDWPRSELVKMIGELEEQVAFLRSIVDHNAKNV